jgi:hypothetical protein
MQYKQNHKTPSPQKQNTDIDPQHQKIKWPLSHTVEDKQEKSRNYSNTLK